MSKSFPLRTLALISCVVCCVAFALPNTSIAGDAASNPPCRGEGTHDGFSYALFDGKTLNGWNVENDCNVTIHDGMLLLKSGNGWLRSDHKFRDFKLHIEWAALQKEKYDAGIYIRTLPGGKPFPKQSYQINLLQGKEGNLGKLPEAKSSGLIHPAGFWNEFDITVEGDKVSTTINGVHAWTASGLKIANGHVGVQVEVPQGGKFWVRNIVVTELNYKSLFNGKDFTGWEGAGKPAATCWRVVDGNLECTGEKGPWLRSLEEFGDFSFRFDYQVSPGGNSGVYVRVPENGNHHRHKDDEPPAGFEVQILDDAASKYAKLKDYQYCGSVYAIAPATKHVGKPAGNWNTLEINCNGHQISIIHNGVMIVNASPDEFPNLNLRKLKGFLGMQNHSTVVRYRNIRIGPAVTFASGSDVATK